MAAVVGGVVGGLVTGGNVVLGTGGNVVGGNVVAGRNVVGGTVVAGGNVVTDETVVFGGTVVVAAECVAAEVPQAAVPIKIKTATTAVGTCARQNAFRCISTPHPLAVRAGIRSTLALVAATPPRWRTLTGGWSGVKKCGGQA
ncbi:MAG: hypothetical protein ACRDZ8_19735 [Acidimicrobiales bacterium]